MSKEGERKYTTESGVEVYGYRNPHLHGFFVSLFFRAGSMFEDERSSGITHFLEHAMIRSLNVKRGGKLNETLDRFGVDLGASTFSEMVQFYTSGSTKRISFGIELITELLKPLALPRTELDAERERIKAEIRENDERGSLANFSNAIVHKNTSLALPITGTVSSVSRISGKRLEEYRREVFTRDNIFFYVTGSYTDGDIAELCRLIDAAELPQGKRRENIAPVSAEFGKRRGRVELKNADFTVLRFTFDMDMKDLSLPATDLIYDMLIGGDSSILFREISEERGLCYDIQGSTERYGNIGSFAFTVEVKESRVYETAELVLKLLSDFRKTAFPEDMLMKASYVDNSEMLLDDSRELNFTFAYDNRILGASYSSVEDRAEAYKAVTSEQVRRAAESIFRPENLTLTLKGKRKKIDLARLEAIVSSFKQGIL